MAEEGSQYSPLVGLVFVFNLIVGTGALTMPRAFQDAGWLLSIILVTLIAFSSYVSVTLVIEAMACANAILRRQEETGSKNLRETSGWASDDDRHFSVNAEEKGLLNSTAVGRSYESVNGIAQEKHIPPAYFNITTRVEMGQMVSMFSNKVGVIIFYVVMAIYLYGDLAIYSAAVPKSLRDVMCTYQSNASANITLDDSLPCWPGSAAISRMSAYRLSVVAFTLLLGPFVFFNVQKTMLLQVVTSALRWIAFISMIVLACIKLAGKRSQNESNEPRPPVADFTMAPNLFGVCVYAFMCHHSLPSLVTPIRTKNRLLWLFAGDFVLILAFYLLLSLTGSFAFPDLPDLYTLNFEPDTASGDSAARGAVVLQYFLALYPVFTISASYPIIGITLRNNLKALAAMPGQGQGSGCACSSGGGKCRWFIERLAFPLAVLLPPLAIALATNDLQFLVGVTGSYAGVGIQYFVPIALAVRCRRALRQAADSGDDVCHVYRSPFNRAAWLIVLAVWSAGCVILVTYNHVSSGK